ncbi:MAG: hypothetical protein OEV45_14300 [Desulfobacteraceae bacterium]|nr:hypothetical protein [Desulfobacteraceae bacterium]
MDDIQGLYLQKTLPEADASDPSCWTDYTSFLAPALIRNPNSLNRKKMA